MSDMCKVRNSKGERCDREANFWVAEGVCAAHKHRLLTHGHYDADRPIRKYTKSQLVRGGGSITPGTSVEERFWNRVQKGEHWIWSGSRMRSGTPTMWDGKHTITALRFMWSLMHPGEIPAGAQIRRTCTEILCVKPSHLEMVGGSIEQKEAVAA